MRPCLPITSRQILVADDDPVSRTLLTSLLVAAGYQITAVADGNSALDHLGREHFDCAIVDEYMPGLRGSELAERLHAGVRPYPPLILLSSEPCPDITHPSISCQLEKPVNRDQLLATLALLTVKPLRA